MNSHVDEILLILSAVLIYSSSNAKAGRCGANEKSCAARKIDGQSVICVCNTTYCDEFTREIPKKGHYITYTSSKAGSRFKKSFGKFKPMRGQENITILDINPNKKYQKIEGFGGAVTDAVGINIKSLPSHMQHDLIKRITITKSIPPDDAKGIGAKHVSTRVVLPTWRVFPRLIVSEVAALALIEAVVVHVIEGENFVLRTSSYFSSRGLEYNMMRVPIGSSDFSTHAYFYNEYPVNDTELSNFTLTYDDLQYKIPIIKACMNVSTSPVHIVGSVWSLPDWMKDSHGDSGVSRLKDEYMQTYALYYLKFLQLYAENGINLWAITTTNEPLDDVLPFGNWLTALGWSSQKMGEWIVNNLGPTIRNSSFKDVKIIAGDDQRFSIPIWFNIVMLTHPRAVEYIDGVASHFYFDSIVSPMTIKEALKNYPDKFVISTEACEGYHSPPDERVILGSWDRAKSYIVDIIQDLLNDVVGWIDWNMCLDTKGGPNWIENFVDSPIIVNAEKREFYKQPMYYAMGHVAKFVQRDSYRIEMNNITFHNLPEGNVYGFKNNIFVVYNEDETPSYDSVAFLTPSDTIVVVIHNDGPAKPIIIKIGEKKANLQLEESSITTVEFLNQEF